MEKIITLKLKRFLSTVDLTLGILSVNEVPHCFTLEPPVRFPQKPSCIPAGSYELFFEFSPKFGRALWEFKGTPGFSEIKFHPGNLMTDTQGCILVGESAVFDARAPGGFRLAYSTAALDNLHRSLSPENRARIEVFDLLTR